MAVGIAAAVGKAAGVGIAASGAAVFVTADVGACVGSGLTPCSDEVVVLESVPFEGMGSGSSEHPVSRRASTAMLSTRPMIDFDIPFTSLTSLCGTLLAPHHLTFHRMGGGPGRGAHGNTGCCHGCLYSVEDWGSSSTGTGHRSPLLASYDCLDFSAPMTRLAARKAALVNVNRTEFPGRI